MPSDEAQLLEALNDIAELTRQAVEGRRGSTASGRARSRALQTDPINLDIRGNIFEITAEWSHDESNRTPGSLSIDVANGSGRWIDFIFESVYPQSSIIWQTGHLANGESSQTSLQLVYHIGKAIHIKRWRPGVFDIPGDGGGEVYFELPYYGDVAIRVSVTG